MPVEAPCTEGPTQSESAIASALATLPVGAVFLEEGRGDAAGLGRLVSVPAQSLEGGARLFFRVGCG